jgi:CelD/BcsL family acetyltransferase involved in cellulose biosynthesis
VEVEIEPLHDFDLLARQWSHVEASAESTFFNSWAWTGTWIRLLTPANWPHVCRIHSGDRLVAIAVLGSLKRRRFGVPFRQLVLNASGDADIDSIHIEMNQVLAERGFEKSAVRALLGVLCNHKDTVPWDQLLLPGVTDSKQFLDAASDYHLETDSVARAAPYVDLNDARANPDGLTGMLEAKGRYAVRKARADYERTLGRPRLTRAGTVEDARGFLANLARLHEIRWTSKGETGAFASKPFATFHWKLVENYFSSGNIDLFRIDCGDTEIGYVYAFRYRDVAYFYQCGFDYAALPNHNQPGYFALPLVIAHYAASAARYFEFLAGDNGYKRRLSSHARTLGWLEVQRPGLKTALLRLYRRLR